MTLPTSNRCDGLTRRDSIQLGALSALGLNIGSFLPLQNASAMASPNAIAPKAKSCILIWLDGGPTHLDTFDPKPDAPVEIRGPLSSIKTNVTDIRLNECFTQTAKLMDKVAIVRSMTSPLGEHNFGTHYMMTGYKPSPAIEYPAFGSTIAQVRKSKTILPSNVAIPKFTGNISGNGFLPTMTRPFSVGGNPATGDFRVRDLEFYRGLNLDRLNRRREFVNAIDQFSRDQDQSAAAIMHPELERAYNLIASPKAKKSFDLSEEKSKTRQRYGSGNNIGQSCLLARRLVERGVPFVTVTSTGWDSHQNIANLKSRFGNDRNAHLPSLDRAFSALIEDLDERKMLDETLVVVMGEFGRTPKVNASGGRDHWPNVFSVALCGAGIQGGQVIGSSDKLGEFPHRDPVTPADLSATIYTLLGIDPALDLATPDGRSVRVAPDNAKLIRQLI